MEKTTNIITIHSVEEIPALEAIQAMPRGQTWKLIFEKEVQGQREAIGQKLKDELLGFQVGIHRTPPEINIVKLITDEEIDVNQDFFEQTAKDYRELAGKLLFKLVDKYDLNLNKDFPLKTFNELKRSERQIGKVEGWKYYVHGFHCGFENHKTGQQIETPLIFGLEFGDLDPYFFSRFIKSTPQYRPLPVEIFVDYADGLRINQRMVALGKFERINSNIGNHYGVVVADREKVEIKSYLDLRNE
ncbi:MAG: DUF6896 domain-containing protein [Bacteroidia bacterium]